MSSGPSLKKSSCIHSSWAISWSNWLRSSRGDGGWLSRDPIGEGGGLNVYGMVGNGPVNSIDRLGLEVGPLPPGAFTGDPPTNISMPSASVRSFLTSPIMRMTTFGGLVPTVDVFHDEIWFESYRPKSLEAARKHFKRKLESFRKELCKGARVPDLGVFGVGPKYAAPKNGTSEGKLGDPQQDNFELVYMLGYFDFQVSETNLRRQGNRIIYELTLDIIDRYGDQRKYSEDMHPFLVPFFGEERKVRLGRWKVIGSFYCCE